MELKSRLICRLFRDVVNNHSPEDAARILFMDHYGKAPGSGWLPDYLDALPNVEIDRKKMLVRD